MAARARLALLALLAAALATSCARAAQQPNFIVILTDDQDRVLDSTNVKYMPKLQEHLARGGLELSNFRVSSPECCPSRVNLFLGRLTHNHNVTTYKPPYGSYDKFRALGLDEEYLPKWMQQKGYRTYFAGKLMNYFQPRPDGSYPKYWNDFWAFVHPYTYDYYDPTVSHNGAPEKKYVGAYQTDFLADRAEEFIGDGAASGQPFYVHISTTAPHQLGNKGAPIPAKRHSRLYPDAKVPRLANWNELDVSDKSSHVQSLPILLPEDEAKIEGQYRARLQSLRAVDEMLDRIVIKLAAEGVLDNTYIIYTSDNGYHMGSHRMQPGKRYHYEEDTLVPFFIRGPGIPAGSSSRQLATMVDIAPTMVQLAGGALRPDFDGIALDVKNPSVYSDREFLTTEEWNDRFDIVYKTALVCLDGPEQPGSTPATAGRRHLQAAAASDAAATSDAGAGAARKLSHHFKAAKKGKEVGVIAGNLIDSVDVLEMAADVIDEAIVDEEAQADGAHFEGEGMFYDYDPFANGGDVDDEADANGASGAARKLSHHFKAAKKGKEVGVIAGNLIDSVDVLEMAVDVIDEAIVDEEAQADGAHFEGEGMMYDYDPFSDGSSDEDVDDDDGVEVSGSRRQLMSKKAAKMAVRALKKQHKAEIAAARAANMTAKAIRAMRREQKAARKQLKKEMGLGAPSADNDDELPPPAGGVSDLYNVTDLTPTERKKIQRAQRAAAKTLRRQQAAEKALAKAIRLGIISRDSLQQGTVDPATLQLSQLSSHKCYKYTSWCTGEHELYDLAADPWEMQNIFRYADPRIIQRLDAALTVLAKCVGDECHNPAKYMHPTAGFTRFSQSLAPQYDVHYAQLPKFYFRQCLAYYTQKNEVGWFKPA